MIYDCVSIRDVLILLETRLKPTDDILRLKIKEEYI
jgi:hypothetical protein